MTDFLLAPGEKPDWFEYPRAYIVMLESGWIQIPPWKLLTRTQVISRSANIRKRYPHHECVAFASRIDMDEIVCWTRAEPTVVTTLLDFEPIDFEVGPKFLDTWDFIRHAVEDMIDYVGSEELE
jgi:hypothetical protein